MNIEIPAVPVGVLTLLAFFAPYAVALINRPEWPTAARKWVSVGVAVALAAIVLAVYFAATGEIPQTWWAFLLLSVVVVSASYTLVTRRSATRLELATSPETGSLPAQSPPYADGHGLFK